MLGGNLAWNSVTFDWPRMIGLNLHAISALMAFKVFLSISPCLL